MSRAHTYVLLTASLVSLAACDDEPVAARAVDSVQLISVSPSVGLVDGQETEFKTFVKYGLATLETADIAVQFNNGSSPVLWLIVPESVVKIAQGEGQLVICVRALAKNWREKGNFVIAVVMLDERANVISLDWRQLVFDDHRRSCGAA